MASVATAKVDRLDGWVANIALHHVDARHQEALQKLTHLSDARYGVAIAAVAVAACGVIAGLRGLALAVTLVGGTNLSAVLLAEHFERMLLWHGQYVSTVAASAPSNHAALSASLAAALAIAVPARHRPIAIAAGTAWATTIGGAVLLLRTHALSDVVSGWLLAAGWSAVALIAFRPLPAPKRTGGRGRVGRVPAAATAGLAVLSLVAVAGAARQDLLAALEHPQGYVLPSAWAAGVAGATWTIVNRLTRWRRSVARRSLVCEAPPPAHRITARDSSYPVDMRSR